MATATTTRTFEAGLGDRVSAFLKDVTERLERRRLFNRTFKELNELSARELDDLGLSRGSLRSVAYEAAYGK